MQNKATRTELDLYKLADGLYWKEYFYWLIFPAALLAILIKTDKFFSVPPRIQRDNTNRDFIDACKKETH